jgi:hypothetical protein
MSQISTGIILNTFDELLNYSFSPEINALCWQRQLEGDFSEIVKKIPLRENIVIISKADLLALDLTEAGQLARDIIISDISLLEAEGAAPILNLISAYPSEEDDSFFSTDVYSYHVDSSPVPTNTFLCTYYGECSEILANAEAVQKIMVPEIREGLMKIYDIREDEFEDFCNEHFFDLHYQPKTEAEPLKLGLGNMWRLAVKHPGSEVLPCIHRAPKENAELRLLLIC